MVLVIHVPVYLVAFFFSEPAESENLKDKQSVLTSPPSDSDALSCLKNYILGDMCNDRRFTFVCYILTIVGKTRASFRP